jgi:hypothetical protein
VAPASSSSRCNGGSPLTPIATGSTAVAWPLPFLSPRRLDGGCQIRPGRDDAVEAEADGGAGPPFLPSAPQRGGGEVGGGVGEEVRPTVGCRPSVWMRSGDRVEAGSSGGLTALLFTGYLIICHF